MADPDKVRIRPLDERSDYTLWRIRIVAAIDAKGLTKTLSDTDDDTTEFKDSKRQAGNIIVSALSDQALRVVRSVMSNPKDMLEKLDRRYDSKTTASKIAKMSELVSMRYTSIRDDMARHVDRMAALIEQLRSMKTTLDDSLAIGILVASIDVPSLLPITAAIKTLAESDINWEDVTSRLIEESKTLTSSSGPVDRANAAMSSCQICQKNSHRTENCFLNPMNPHNKLKLSDESPTEILDVQKNNRKSNRRGRRGKLNDKNGERAAMARKKRNGRRTPDRLMLDSGTTSHLTPHADRVHSKTPCDTPISLADDSIIVATSKGVRSVQFSTDDGSTKVSLSDTLIVPNASLSLLSVPALVNKGIGVLFMPGKAILSDL